MSELNRRQFLQSTAAATAAVGLVPAFPALGQTAKPHVEVWPENGTLIPDEGWRLWVDEMAEWKQDAIFLPEDVSRDAAGVVLGKGKPLPVNAPTGGWGVLGAATGVGVTLPSTVEQHYWGKFGADEGGKPRPYTPEEYRYAADDPIPQNGAYFGVSWWYRHIDIPAAMQGKRIFLHVRGAHLRAEVYLNERLVGYSIMEELPFEADLTAAAKPGGENRLAIRITNPFGRFDWVDGLNEQWGAVKLYRSHGFGGLDRGMTISAHGEVRITDVWVLNGKEPNQATAFAKFEVVPSNPTGEFTNDPHVYNAEFIVRNPDQTIVAQSALTANHGREGLAVNYEFTPLASPLEAEISGYHAHIWNLGQPTLYHLHVTLTATKTGHTDTRTVTFGYRSFGPDGLGSNALFRLNGRRMKIYTAISWGYWGINGMWPTPELAEKEVTQAKKLGLNCLNFHRNLAKEDVLRAHDRLGLLRYMEPGAGKMAIGKLPSGAQANAANIVMEKATNTADKFAQRYMFVKCVEMVKAFRSHPCVIEYCLQNEIGADLKNPDTIAILEAMRAEDPSRCIVLNDGFVAPPRKAAQAWFAPWDAKLHRATKRNGAAGGTSTRARATNGMTSSTSLRRTSPTSRRRRRCSRSLARWKDAPRRTTTR